MENRGGRMKVIVARRWSLVAREEKTVACCWGSGICLLRATSDEQPATVFLKGKTLCQ